MLFQKHEKDLLFELHTHNQISQDLTPLMSMDTNICVRNCDFEQVWVFLILSKVI